MANSVRTKSAIYNILSQAGLSIASIFISFLNRFIFLRVLNATYLGVTGLFGNITLIFSLVELGVGNALTQMFYKPFAENDAEELSKVTYTTRVILHGVGSIIILLTVVFTPFLQLFVNDINEVPNMRLIFFLYGTSSSITYFFGYYRTIITADQKAYKLAKIDISWKFVSLLVQSLVLIVSKNFIAYLLSQIALSFLLNLIIRNIVQKEISVINYKAKRFISKADSKKLFKNVAGLSLNKLANVITNGTDNIVISKGLNLTTVGYASNYLMIQQSVNGLAEAVFSPLLAGIGNLCATSDLETKNQFFSRFTFAAFWIYSFFCIASFALANPFISLVFGEDYIIPELASFFMFLDLFCIGLFRVASLFRTAEGLFWYGKFRPLFQALTNLVVSILLVRQTHQLWAVYAGTVASRVLVTIWYEPYVVLKYAMKKRPWDYYKRLVVYICAFFAALGILVWIMKLMAGLPVFAQLVIGVFACIVGVNCFYLLLFFKTDEMRYWASFFKKLLCRS